MVQLVVKEPKVFQGYHEEADTLMAFHSYKISGKMMIRSSDTNVLIILTGLVTKMLETLVIMMDFGSANNRRVVNATGIAKQLVEKQVSLSEAVMGFHAQML